MAKRKHKTFFGKIFGWIGDLLEKANRPFLEAAINITTVVKTTLNSGVADIVKALIPGDIDDKIIELLKPKITSILATELLIKDLADGATNDEVGEIAAKMLETFGGLPDERKARFYTSVAAEIYIFLQEQKGSKVTFGEAAALVESLYKTWEESKK